MGYLEIITKLLQLLTGTLRACHMRGIPLVQVTAVTRPALPRLRMRNATISLPLKS